MTLPASRPLSFRALSFRVLGAVALLAWLAACAGPPRGPVLGDWRGVTPGPLQNYGQIVELVLDGTPDAASGRYRQAITIQNLDKFVGTGTQRWEGTWTREAAPDGRPVFVLHDDIANSIDRYELAQDGSLHALSPDHAPTVGANLYTLFPVSPGYGYGRV